MLQWLIDKLNSKFPFKGRVYHKGEFRKYNNTPYTQINWELSLCAKYVILYSDIEGIKHVLPENEFYAMKRKGLFTHYRKQKRYGERADE